MNAHTVESIDRILNAGGDSDDVLRAVVRELEQESGVAWAGVLFSEDDELVLGPAAGTPAPGRRIVVPILFQGEQVGSLAVDGEVERAALDRIAVLIAAHVLVGWDTGGVSWEP